ncbi:MAG: PilX N-terminal domain-containing pilus assembly protein [Patescibacteria group bacterium]
MKIKNNKGQALVVLLVLMTVMIMVTSVSVVLVLVNSQNASTSELGNEALGAAESGVENALISMLRDPYGYSGDGFGVTVSPGNFPKIITAIGSSNYVKRTLEVGVTYSNNVLGVTYWREIY